MIIRKYVKHDEKGWLRCRVLSFLDSAYYDNVIREKELYENPVIELVAEIDNQIVGLIDVEYEMKIGDVGYKQDKLTAVIWHLAVLPEFRNQRVATKLFDEAKTMLQKQNIEIVQAWTRDDKFVIDWYLNRSFEKKESYFHVYSTDAECDEIAKSKIPKLYICNTFCHYVGDNIKEIKSRFKRVHECSLYEKKISRRNDAQRK